ncbi:hypothetical protein PCE1_001849 [Barthelona sp. PCE]
MGIVKSSSYLQLVQGAAEKYSCTNLMEKLTTSNMWISRPLQDLIVQLFNQLRCLDEDGPMVRSTDNVNQLISRFLAYQWPDLIFIPIYKHIFFTKKHLISRKIEQALSDRFIDAMFRHI